MSTQNRVETSTLRGQRVDISTGEIILTSTPSEAFVNKEFLPDSRTDDVQSNVHPSLAMGVDVIPGFIDAKKAAGLLSIERRSVIRNCVDGKYPGAKKVPVDGVEVWQIPVGSLPGHAQSMMREEVAATLRERLAAQGLPIPGANETRLSPAEYSIAWENYERSGGTHKRRAMAAQEALLTFYRLRGEGFSVGDAERQVASLHGVSKPTLWRYRQATEGHPQMHWLPLLSPRYKGGVLMLNSPKLLMSSSLGAR